MFDTFNKSNKTCYIDYEKMVFGRDTF